MDFKANNSHSLAIFSSSVHLREVISALWTSKRAYESAYEKSPLTGGLKCRVLADGEIAGTAVCVRLTREVSVSRG